MLVLPVTTLSHSRLSCALLLSFVVLGSVACSDADPTPSDPTAAATVDPDDPTDLTNSDPDDLEPPANWSKLSTSELPVTLGIYANNEKNSGTSGDIKLTYINETGTYSCKITGGISSGQKKTCDSSKESSEATYGYDRMYISFVDTGNDDGLRYSSIYVTFGTGTTYTLGDFNHKNNPDLNCFGCDIAWHNCGSCSLDAWGSSGGNTCVSAEIPMNLESESRCVQKSGLTKAP